MGENMLPRNPPRLISMVARSLLAKAFIFSAVFSLSGCEKKAVQTEVGPPPEVLVAQVVKADVPIVREWVGTLDGSENADIRARVNSYLQKKDYQEGRSYVKERDLMFEIDPRPFEAALAEAKSQLLQEDVDSDYLFGDCYQRCTRLLAHFSRDKTM